MNAKKYTFKRFLNSQIELLRGDRLIGESSPDAEKLDRLDCLTLDFSLDDDFERVFVFRLLSPGMC
jgi:hypothetical protein